MKHATAPAAMPANVPATIPRRVALGLLAAWAWPTGAWAQGSAGGGATPVTPSPQSPPSGRLSTRTASIPARGLFVGDQLSESTKRQLTDLMMDAIGSRIEMALLVPTGPWQIDGAGQGDSVLNEARLRALRRYLTDRGVDPNRIFVESRIDAKIKTPRLDVQVITSQAND